MYYNLELWENLHHIRTLFFSLVHCNHPVMDQIPLILEDKYFDINKDFVQFQRCLFWNLRTKTDQYSRRQCVRYTR